MAGITKGLQAAMGGYTQAGLFRKTAGFHRWKMRMKMNKLSNKPKLVGRDEFGNMFFEDSTESFGRNRWVEYARPNKFGGPDPGGVHDGTTDHGFDASQVGPQWHAWLHYMNDDVPGTLKGYDGKRPTYTLSHNYNQTGRAGTPQQQRDRYYPPWHVNSRHYKGQFQEVVEAWVPPGSK